MKYADITEKILKSAFRVHTVLGNGFQEVIYQRALEIEMSKNGLVFDREFEMPIFSIPYFANIFSTVFLHFFIFFYFFVRFPIIFIVF